MMRISLADVSVHVASVLAQVKSGVETARAAGLIAELPEKVDFQMEIVSGALFTVETSAEADTLARTNTTTEAAATDTRTVGQGTTTEQTAVSIEHATGQSAAAEHSTTAYTY